MIPDTDPVRKYCSNCGTHMTHVRELWRRIEKTMPCHGCRRHDVRWDDARR